MISNDERSGKREEQSSLLETEHILDGFFQVEKLHLRHTLHNSEGWSPTLERYILQRPDAVCAVVHHRERKSLFFVRQFRVGVFQKDHGWMTELAAGLIDAGESPEQAVRREVREELGFQIRNLELIRKIYTSPGIISERIYLYYAEVDESDRISAGGGCPEEHEDLEIFEVPVGTLEHFDAGHQIMDAKTVIGIQWYKERFLNT